MFSFKNTGTMTADIDIDPAALEIAKLYGAEGAFKLINASLDQLAKELRSVEANA
jgi:hypothetical protein